MCVAYTRPWPWRAPPVAHLLPRPACRDTAGQERYSSLAPLYYRGASAAAVVYDVTSPESFSKAKYWVSELQKNASGDIGAPRPPGDARSLWATRMHTAAM